jgi:RHH-type proline utilization regulon transcriptional repressor/proline dehydrogenase/delta 1-pyrroline-5-carboxylate dehydrogenase
MPKAFAAPYAPADEAIAADLLTNRLNPHSEREVAALATRLIEAIRKRPGGVGGIEDLLREYSLSTREGLALMALAESLLRVTDSSTADQLIADKLTSGDFVHHDAHSETLLVQAAAFALGLSARLIGPNDTPRGLVADIARRLGVPTLRAATRQAMRLMGAHFVAGETIEEALARSMSPANKRYRHSFDMLGEAARTSQDAERHFAAYTEAIDAIGAQAGALSSAARPSVSVKLSALHPRYEAISRTRVMKELAARLLELARRAKAHDIGLTVDAEEADRLELSLDIVSQVVADASLKEWDGFGVAVQAYQKRARAVIDYVLELAKAYDRRFSVRLVKGAYWDSEIKRAQERGLADYPVFTRKAMTDLHYIACADRLLAAPRLFPQFATHNALTVAMIVERAGDPSHYEFQRLQGMGESLYEALFSERPDVACRIYAPVGPHRDLFAYLVRRLIENGANSSFVARAADPATSTKELIAMPCDVIGAAKKARHSRLVLPKDLYQPLRANSKGVEFGDRTALMALWAEIDTSSAIRFDAAPTTEESASPLATDVLSPIDHAKVGTVRWTTLEGAHAVMGKAARAFPDWDATPVEQRATMLEYAADLIEARRGRLIALLQSEGGKTLDDALAEVREAADLCRYYAGQAQIIAAEETLPGPTGEDNHLRHKGRGVFLCISPWNFPLAIFIGQVAAALVAGNAVVAKPAEQTPLVAQEAIRLLHEAGAPTDVLQFAPGDGEIGATLVADRNVAGVVFTGSTEVARKINQTLAASEGPIVPLIAETGGINAMIVDSTALIEQVIDDVLSSAFRSAGQRCSALRLLCLQEDMAQDCLTMLYGALRELRVGDPREIETHIGPVIDEDAKARLERYIEEMRAQGRILFEGAAPKKGFFVAPHVVRVDRPRDLREEVFGPVLHVATWRSDGFDDLVAEIAGSGYGLTMGLHTRIDSRIRRLSEITPAGNLYVNRNMIGAVVGSQPFGGSGLSGTGPKAGGPDYLRRFFKEATVTINTAALGGDAGLLSLEE